MFYTVTDRWIPQKSIKWNVSLVSRPGYWSSAPFGTTTNVFLVMSIEAWDQISAQICDLVPHVSDLTSLSNENRAMFLFPHLGYKNSGVVCGPSENILNDTRPSQQWRPIFICVLYFFSKTWIYFFLSEEKVRRQRHVSERRWSSCVGGIW